MNRIKYYYDFSRAGRIKYAARQMNWLRYIADPKNQMERMSVVDPLSREWWGSRKRTEAELIHIKLTWQEYCFVYRFMEDAR